MGAAAASADVHGDNFNYDVKVSTAVLGAYPVAEPFLRDERVIDSFSRLDDRARHAKLCFHTLGISSLAFATVALIVEVYAITFRTGRYHLNHAWNFGLHATALVSLILLTR